MKKLWLMILTSQFLRKEVSIYDAADAAITDNNNNEIKIFVRQT